MLKIISITKLDVWNRFCCPVCGRKHFISINHTSVYCEECDAQFSIRETAGDPGYVVDCRIDNVCNIWQLKQQRRKNYKELLHSRLQEKGINPTDFQPYLIDKEGDYKSDWIHVKNGMMYFKDGEPIVPDFLELEEDSSDVKQARNISIHHNDGSFYKNCTTLDEVYNSMLEIYHNEDVSVSDILSTTMVQGLTLEETAMLVGRLHVNVDSSNILVFEPDGNYLLEQQEAI